MIVEKYKKMLAKYHSIVEISLLLQKSRHFAFFTQRKFSSCLVVSKPLSLLSCSIALKNCCFVWNIIVFELNLYDLALESYSLFSIDTQNHMKSISVPWWQIARNGHIITCVFIQLNSNNDQKILYTQANELI